MKTATIRTSSSAAPRHSSQNSRTLSNLCNHTEQNRTTEKSQRKLRCQSTHFNLPQLHDINLSQCQVYWICK